MAERLIVVLAFADIQGVLVPADPVQCESEAKARTLARKFATTHAGVLAWARNADPDLGEYGPPKLIARIGRVPEDVE
jgi:hypothetical protein